MEDEARILRRTRERSGDKLALQTAVVHMCCCVGCIIIGIFSLAIIKSETMERVFGLPLWIGLWLLFTGFAGVQCHIRRTAPYTALYLVFSFLAMFFDLLSIAWMLSIMKKSEAAVISFVCVATFDMGISCLSSALGCNILFADCKMCKHLRRSRHSSSDLYTPASRLAVDLSVSLHQENSSIGVRESVRLSSLASGQARYSRREVPRPGDEPPSYSEAVGPPPPYAQT